MKHIIYAAMLLLCLSIIIGCSKETDPRPEPKPDPDEKATLTVAPTSLTFENSGGAQSISITANKSWTISSSQSWCKVSQASGNATGSSAVNISVTCEENTTYDDRTCTLTVKAGAASQTVEVKQGEGLGLVISQTTYNVSNEAQSIEVEVKANVEYEYSIAEDAKEWITVSGTKALVSSKVRFDIAANESYDEREGVITFKPKDGSLAGTVAVKQSAEGGLIITQAEYALSNEAQSIEVEVKANVEYEYSIAEDAKEWITVSGTKALVSSKVRFDIAANESYDEREGVITFKQKDGSLAGTVTVKQGQSEGLLVEQTEYTVSEEEQILEIKVKSNIDYAVTIDNSCSDWISHIETKSLYETTITLKIAKNAGRKRTGKIVIGKDDLFDEITIIQKNAGNVPEYNQIFYTTSDEAIIRPRWDAFGGTKIISNEYVEDTGIITFDRDLTSIGFCAFFDCSSLTSIIIPESVTSIEIQAFASCRSLTSITIPKSVTSIGREAFQYCLSLTSITIPKSVANIEFGTFQECSNLASIIIPESVTNIERYAFSGCSNLTEIIIPGNVTNIGDYAFINCGSLTSVVILKGVTNIGFCAFASCQSLTSVSIPESVTSIGYGTFANCTSLTEVVIPESVTNIESGTFQGCSLLATIVIPEGVTNIEERAFADCNSLAKVYCHPVTPPSCGAYGTCFPSTTAIYVPMESVEAYKKEWSDYADQIQGYEF